MTSGGRRNRIGYRTRRLLRAARDKKETDMDLVLTPEDRKAMDEQLDLVTRNLTKIDGSVADLKPKIERLVLERDVALGALALAVMREEKATSALKHARELLRGMGFVGAGPAAIHRLDRVDKVMSDAIRELDLQIPPIQHHDPRNPRPNGGS